MLRWISVARVEFIRQRRLERLIMRGKRSVLQASGHINPAQTVLVQDEWRITGNRIETFRACLRLVIWGFAFYETGNVYAGPFFRIPPHQFFPFAPRTTVRSRAGAIVNNSAIARPTKAPPVAKVISGFSRVRLVNPIATKYAGVNPAAARSRTVRFHLWKTIYLRPMVRCSIAIKTENGAFSVRLRISVPAVDLREHGFHFWITEFVFRIPPVE